MAATKNVIVRPVRTDDVASLKPILNEWVRDVRTGEVLDELVDNKLHRIEDSISGSDARYFVAEAADGRVIGVMGLETIDDTLRPYARTERPVELVNAFVARDQRGKGVGKSLIAALEKYAAAHGATEIMLTSHPQYKETAWELYDKLFERIATLEDNMGPGLDEPIWRKSLAAVQQH